MLFSIKHLRMHGGWKLAQRWIGPFVVQERVGTMAYRLALPVYYHFQSVFHVSLLKGYDSSGEHRAEVEPTPVVLTLEREPEYEVEKMF